MNGLENDSEEEGVFARRGRRVGKESDARKGLCDQCETKLTDEKNQRRGRKKSTDIPRGGGSVAKTEEEKRTVGNRDPDKINTLRGRDGGLTWLAWRKRKSREYRDR